MPANGWVKPCAVSCVHLPITDELLAKAREEDRLITLQKGVNNPTTRDMSPEKHLLGSLGQNAVADYIESQGFVLDSRTPFFDPNIHRDEYDFIHNGLANDVKTQKLHASNGFARIVYRGTKFRIHDEDREKPIDIYTFTSIDMEQNIIHLPGVISHKRFWKISKPWESERMIYPCHVVPAFELYPFEKFLQYRPLAKS